ncbi:MAG: DUF4339 domain-containing protein [Verrucomicrobia bacterium]|nr:DUF4339 domain-containing protein [Verrucomicrobiota bacterium]
MSFWVLKNDKRIGPLTREQVQQAVAAGKLAPTDLCQQDGQATWTPISTALASSVVSATTPVGMPPLAAVPPQAGKLSQIYIAKDGQRFGPFSPEQAKALMASGQFSPSHLAWHEGLAAWAPLGTLCLANPPSPTPLPVHTVVAPPNEPRRPIPFPAGKRELRKGSNMAVGGCAIAVGIMMMVGIISILWRGSSEKADTSETASYPTPPVGSIVKFSSPSGKVGLFSDEESVRSMFASMREWLVQNRSFTERGRSILLNGTPEENAQFSEESRQRSAKWSEQMLETLGRQGQHFVIQNGTRVRMIEYFSSESSLHELVKTRPRSTNAGRFGEGGGDLWAKVAVLEGERVGTTGLLNILHIHLELE